MKIIVGLGNPGTEYTFTRHNVGWLFLDYLAQNNSFSAWHEEKDFSAFIAKGQIEGESILLIKPQTFMNLSGNSVQKVINFYKASPTTDLIVVHDDLDLELGKYKITSGVGPRGHNGLLSIYHCLNNKDFLHLRIGTDNRNGDRTIPAINYVLTSFSSSEKEVLNQVFEKIIIAFKKDYNSLKKN